MYTSPRLDFDLIPDSEKQAAHYIEQILMSFEQRLLEFKHSLSLARYADSQVKLFHAERERLTAVQLDFDASRETTDDARLLSADNDERQREAMDWLKTAIRQGAIVAYEYWMNTQDLNDHIGSCPTLMSKIDLSQKKLATKLFAKSFPSIALVRHSAAHSGEMGLSSDDINKNAIRVDRGQASNRDTDFVVFIGGSFSMEDGSYGYEASIKGKMVSYRLSDDTLFALSSVTNRYWSCFAPVERWSSRTHRETMM